MWLWSDLSTNTLYGQISRQLVLKGSYYALLRSLAVVSGVY